VEKSNIVERVFLVIGVQCSPANGLRWFCESELVAGNVVFSRNRTNQPIDLASIREIGPGGWSGDEEIPVRVGMTWLRVAGSGTSTPEKHPRQRYRRNEGGARVGVLTIGVVMNGVIHGEKHDRFRKSGMYSEK
jgi:hypothetical protein